ncbi:MAG: transposase [Candidatus Berkelbacteria bacterium]
MQYRKDPLITGECYHVFTRSIAKYIIFNNDNDFTRIIETINLFHFSNFKSAYPSYKKLSFNTQNEILKNLQKENQKLVEIIAYCVMPTHIHLVLRQLEDNAISNFMSRILNGYSKYFNICHQRSGPLFEGRFKSVHIKDDEQLLHLTRYIHLNPVSAGLIDKPEDWQYSSYHEYLDDNVNKICDFNLILDFVPVKYEQFVNDQKSYQRELQIIKNLTIDV